MSGRFISITVFLALLTMSGLSWGENIDPYNSDSQYAWGENVGWLNFEPGQGPGVQVTLTKVEGYVWGENIGWINLSPVKYGGVINDRYGNLSGYAWGENVGWINFGPNYGGVTIDGGGKFDGFAWGENIGWINFGLVENSVVVCTVTLDDLANFASQWLEKGMGSSADLWVDDQVDLQDFGVFASYWLVYCPDGWALSDR